MKQLPLKEIAQIEQGVCPYSNEVWLLNLDMVESKTGRIIEYQYVPQNEIGSSTVSFDCSNVLYSKLRPYLNKVVLPQKCGYATSEMIPLKPKTDIITREYLAYFLRSNDFVNYINSKTYGAKMPRVNVAELKSVQVPCPSLVKQKEITQLLDKLITLIDMEREQLKAYDDLIKSRFNELFGDLTFNPYNWPIFKVSDISTFLKSGLSRKLSDEDLGMPVVRSGNIQNGQFIYNDIKYWYVNDPQGSNTADYVLDDGDVLVNFINSASQIGKTAVFRDIGRNCIYTTNILRMKLVDSCDQYYYNWFAMTDFYYRQLQNIIQPAVNQASFTTANFLKLRIPIPPIEKQLAFANFVKQVDKLKVAVQKSLDEIQKLFDSLMQQYFG